MGKRGPPRKSDALTPAERQRRTRARKAATGATRLEIELSRTALDRLDSLANQYRLTRNQMIERLLEVNGAILDDIMSDQSRCLAERIEAELTQGKKKRRRKNK